MVVRRRGSGGRRPVKELADGVDVGEGAATARVSIPMGVGFGGRRTAGAAMTCTKAVSPQALPTGAGRRLSGGEDERRTVAPARRGRDGCGTANYTSERRSPCTLEAGGAERGVSRGGSGRPQPTGDRGDLRRCHLPEMSPLQTLTSTPTLPPHRRRPLPRPLPPLTVGAPPPSRRAAAPSRGAAPPTGHGPCPRESGRVPPQTHRPGCSGKGRCPSSWGQGGEATATARGGKDTEEGEGGRTGGEEPKKKEEGGTGSGRGGVGGVEPATVGGEAPTRGPHYLRGKEGAPGVAHTDQPQGYWRWDVGHGHSRLDGRKWWIGDQVWGAPPQPPSGTRRDTTTRHTSPATRTAEPPGG